MVIKRFVDQYRFLSNFYPCNIEYEGVKHRSTETAYQAAKTDIVKEKYKIALMTAGESKRYARTLKLRPDWEEVKLKVMEDLVRQKFTNNRHLKESLLMTGEQELIEGNAWGDVWWGICKGVGHNHLGKILMKIRQELRDYLSNKE